MLATTARIAANTHTRIAFWKATLQLAQLHSSPPLQSPLWTPPNGGQTVCPIKKLNSQFFNPAGEAEENFTLVGRGWSVRELRLKSFDDLHKLWHVLYKERNLLITEQAKAKHIGQNWKQPDRKTYVRRGMQAIRVVLGERQRATNAKKRAVALAVVEAEAGAA